MFVFHRSSFFRCCGLSRSFGSGDIFRIVPGRRFAVGGGRFRTYIDYIRFLSQVFSKADDTDKIGDGINNGAYTYSLDRKSVV